MTGREARFWEKMHRFDLEIKYIEGAKNLIADILSRFPLKLDVNTLFKISKILPSNFATEQRACLEIGKLYSVLSGVPVKLNPVLSPSMDNLTMIDEVLY